VGLSGEIRPVNRGSTHSGSTEKLGFSILFLNTIKLPEKYRIKLDW
jgi:predicted ATP-dependent serine protease